MEVMCVTRIYRPNHPGGRHNPARGGSCRSSRRSALFFSFLLGFLSSFVSVNLFLLCVWSVAVVVCKFVGFPVVGSNVCL